MEQLLSLSVYKSRHNFDGRVARKDCVAVIAGWGHLQNWLQNLCLIWIIYTPKHVYKQHTGNLLWLNAKLYPIFRGKDFCFFFLWYNRDSIVLSIQILCRYCDQSAKDSLVWRPSSHFIRFSNVRKSMSENGKKSYRHCWASLGESSTTCGEVKKKLHPLFYTLLVITSVPWEPTGWLLFLVCMYARTSKQVNWKHSSAHMCPGFTPATCPMHAGISSRAPLAPWTAV